MIEGRAGGAAQGVVNTVGVCSVLSILLVVIYASWWRSHLQKPGLPDGIDLCMWRGRGRSPHSSFGGISLSV